MPFRKETITTDLKKICVYDEKRKVLVIQNIGDYIVLLTDKPKETSNTPFLKLEPNVTLSLIKELGDETRAELYAKTKEGVSDVIIVEFFEE